MLKRPLFLAIVAVDLNLGIGFQDEILFHNKIDLSFFKAVSLSINDCIVGRVTFETLPSVINKTRNLQVLSKSVSDTYKTIQNKDSLKEKRYLIIGGSQVYKYFSKDIGVWFITTHKQKATKVDSWFDRDLYSEIINSSSVFKIYEDSSITIKMYVRNNN